MILRLIYLGLLSVLLLSSTSHADPTDLEKVINLLKTHGAFYELREGMTDTIHLQPGEFFFRKSTTKPNELVLEIAPLLENNKTPQITSQKLRFSISNGQIPDLVQMILVQKGEDRYMPPQKALDELRKITSHPVNPIEFAIAGLKERKIYLEKPGAAEPPLRPGSAFFKIGDTPNTLVEVRSDPHGHRQEQPIQVLPNLDLQMKVSSVVVTQPLKDYLDNPSRSWITETPPRSPSNFDPFHNPRLIPRSDPLNSISQKQCEELEFNNIDKMAPDTDQKETPLCWAHAIAALLESELCLASPHDCKKAVSRSFVATHAEGNRLANPKGVTNVSQILKKIVDKGKVCLAHYSINPYDELGGEFIERLKKLFHLINENKCNIQNNSDLNTHIVLETLPLMTLMPLSEMTRQPKKSLNPDTIDKLAKNSKDENEFVEKVLLINCDENTKIPLLRRGKLSVENKVFFDLSSNQSTPPPLSNYVEVLKKPKKTHRNSLLSICYSNFLRDFSLIAKSGCGAHLVAHAGTRWNKGQCEMYLKNSHGEDATLPSDWYNAEAVLKNTREIIWLKGP